MTQLLISPAERPPITNLGTNSPLPEMVGADVTWQGLHGMAGVQRKTVSDMIASVRPAPGQEPRLGKEVKQMTDSLHYRFLVIEGVPQWDTEGRLMDAHANWTLKNHNGVLLSVQSQGIMCLTSRNQYETCRVIQHLVEWTQKEDHVSSLMARNKPQSDGWGKLTDRMFAVHFMSAIPGIGVELAGRIFDHFGSMPLMLTAHKHELEKVPGLGRRRISELMRAIPNYDTNDPSTTIWLAAVIDCEGTISASKIGGVLVSVSNTHRDFLDHVSRITGVGTINPQVHEGPNRKPSWKWEARANDAELIIRRVKNHLFIKREQAEVALELRLFAGQAGVAPTQELLDTRQRLVARLRHLNRKGIETTEQPQEAS